MLLITLHSHRVSRLAIYKTIAEVGFGICSTLTPSRAEKRRGRKEHSVPGFLKGFGVESTKFCVLKLFTISYNNLISFFEFWI